MPEQPPPPMPQYQQDVDDRSQIMMDEDFRKEAERDRGDRDRSDRNDRGDRKHRGSKHSRDRSRSR